MAEPPTLKPLHSHESLLRLKLEAFREMATEDLIASLKPGESNSLKTRPDGTILDGHQRIAVLQERHVMVDDLPREIVLKH